MPLSPKDAPPPGKRSALVELGERPLLLGSRARFGMGHLPDPPDPRDWPAGPFLGAPSSLPRECLGLRAHVRRVIDQGRTSRCVGCAVGSAVDVRQRKIADGLRAKGMRVPDPAEPSSVGIYTLSRGYLRDDPSRALEDDGTNPRAAFLAIRDSGVPALSAWPDDAPINGELPWDVESGASAARVTAFRRVDTIGDSMLLEIANAVAGDYPVPYARQVDAAFEDYSGKGAVGPCAEGESLGGHYTLIVGYVLDSASGSFNPQDLVFLVLNSWGEGWGDKGFYWSRASALTAPGSGDAYVVEVNGPSKGVW